FDDMDTTYEDVCRQVPPTQCSDSEMVNSRGTDGNLYDTCEGLDGHYRCDAFGNRTYTLCNPNTAICKSAGLNRNDFCSTPILPKCTATETTNSRGTDGRFYQTCQGTGGHYYCDPAGEKVATTCPSGSTCVGAGVNHDDFCGTRPQTCTAAEM